MTNVHYVCVILYILAARMPSSGRSMPDMQLKYSQKFSDLFSRPAVS